MGELLSAASLIPALLLTFLAPGLALSYAIAPASVRGLGGASGRAGIAILLSLVVAGFLGLLLAIAGILTPVVSLISVVSVTAVSVAIAAKRGARPGFRMALPARSFPAILLGVLLVGGIAGAVVAPQFRIIQRDRMPTSGVTWYYWDLADQSAREGSLPEESLEWGRARPYPTTYVFFSATTALYEQFTTADVRAQMEAFRFAVLGAALLFAWLFFRRLLDRPVAGLTVLLLFGGYFFLGRFSAYRPESFGLTLAMAGSWCLLAAVQECTRARGPGELPHRSSLPAVLAAAAFAAAYLSHAIPLSAVSIFAVAILVGGVVARTLDLRATARATGTVAVAAALIGLGVTFAIDQEFPLARAAAPGGEVDGRDLTWQIILATEGATEYRPAPNFRAMLDVAAKEPWERLDIERRPYLLLLFLLPLPAWRAWRPGERQLAIGAYVFAVTLALVAGGFYVLYTTYVPQRTGPDRLAPYIVLTLAPIVALGLAGAARGVAGWIARRRAGSSSGRPIELWLLCGIVAILGVAVFFPTARTFVRRLDRQAITLASYKALRSLDETLPAHAVILANTYTDGSINGIVHRLGLINGRVPFQAVPEFRDETIDLLERTRRFFADPGSEPNLLADYGVTHLLVAKKTWVLGGSALYPVATSAIASLPGVTLIHSFENLDVYAVADTALAPVIPGTDRKDALPWLVLAYAVSGGALYGVARLAGGRGRADDSAQA